MFSPTGRCLSICSQGGRVSMVSGFFQIPGTSMISMNSKYYGNSIYYGKTIFATIRIFDATIAISINFIFLRTIQMVRSEKKQSPAY